MIEIGFGSLLKLSLSECHGQLSRFLVESFDHCRAALVLDDNQKHFFTEDDIFAIYNSPWGNKAVKEAKTDNESQSLQNCLRLWERGGTFLLEAQLHREWEKILLLEETMVMSLRGTL